MPNPFARAVIAGLSKNNSYKQYLRKTENMCEDTSSAEIFRINVLDAAMRNSKIVQLDPATRSAVIEELNKVNTLITPETIDAAIATVEADTAIEQKSWWGSFKSWLFS